MKSTAFVKAKFREYYEGAFSLGDSPSMIENREFGFASFENWMLRHRTFRNELGLKSFLHEFVPKDAYVSSAYYQNPDMEMDKKGWTGADLLFDIDADHIATSCEKLHDSWTCHGCGQRGKGEKPGDCPACGSEKIETSTWPCEECLNSAKMELAKLINILSLDFGFAEEDIRVFFSGHRGYHVEIAGENIRMLDAVARREIVDYIILQGFDDARLGLDETGRRDAPRSNVLTKDGLGIASHLLKRMRDFVATARREDYAKTGLDGNSINVILKNQDRIVKILEGAGALGSVKGLGHKNWRKLAGYCKNQLSAGIDTVVTTDLHRLIRLPNSLNSRTGLKKMMFPISSLETFDPFESAVSFKEGTVRVMVKESPEFRMSGDVFGPYENNQVELPTAAAILLVCKDKAEVLS